MVEFGHKLDEKMKAMGTNSDRKETGTQINGVDQKEERNIQAEKNVVTRIQKVRSSLGTSRTSLKFQHLNHRGAKERRGRANN